jgi:hypothetical protein
LTNVNLIFAILTIALYSQQHWANILDQELIYFFLGEKKKKVQLVEIIAWYFLILFIKTFLRLLFIWHCRKKWISSSSTLQVLQSLRCLGIFLYLHSSISNGWSLVLNLVKSSGGIKGGLWGLFLNIIYFYQKIKGKCCCITKKNTRVSVLKIYEYSIF